MTKICSHRGCGRRAAPLHALGGPQPSFCDLERHNASTVHQERERLKKEESKRARQGVPRGVPAHPPLRALRR